MRHSKYRYFKKREWAEAFMNGDVRFKSLSYYHQIEDGQVRGDANEGSILSKPESGLIMHNKTQGKSYTIPEGAVGSSVNTGEMFILCGSNSMTDELRLRFEAECCVEVLKVATLCARIEVQLPSTAIFRAQRIDYYSHNDEMGIRWAFPDKITFSKVEGYSWQDEYRFAFSLTDALAYGKTSQQLKLPGPNPSVPAAQISPRIACGHNLTTSTLRDTCRIHVF